MRCSDDCDIRNVRDPIENILAWKFEKSFIVLVIIFLLKKENISKEKRESW